MKPAARATLIRDINGRRFVWQSPDGTLHYGEGADVHPGIRLLWTKCGAHDIPSNAAWIKRHEDAVKLARRFDDEGQKDAWRKAMTRTYKCSTIYEFEYEPIGKNDPGMATVRINFDYTPGSPETGRYGLPEHYDPGSGCEIAFDYAEREIKWPHGPSTWQRLRAGEWLEEQCRAWLESRDESDLENDLPDSGPDPDDMHDRMMDR